MCIIVYKPSGMKLPNKQVLETCFQHNSDGAGFMYPCKGQVKIKKGFMDFSSFEENLNETLKGIDEVKTPMVLHFRITTQGGVNQACTHPFPLSRNMSDLRQLQCSTNIGIAHNGIISLTSESGGYYGYGSYKTKVIDYSDTMKFITDYLSLIIKNSKYYKDKDTLELIERLVGSKLAILDSNGHCELIGDFIKDDGIYYSNSSYKPYTYKTSNTKTYKTTSNKKTKKYETDYSIFDEIEDYGWNNYYGLEDIFEDCYDIQEGHYDFDCLNTCPIDECVNGYCEYCKYANNCAKTMPLKPDEYMLESGKILKPTKEFYRCGGVLFGISTDDDDNLYEVIYTEHDSDFFPSGAHLIKEDEWDKVEKGGNN